MFSFYRNSGNFLPELVAKKIQYTTDEITAVISVRAHKANPWVIERLESLANHYAPRPLFLIVDFGSEPSFSQKIRNISKSNGFSYLRVEDQGVFSLSIARNAGAQFANTDLLYFTDIDFFSETDHFGRLADFANKYHFSVIRDLVLNIPAYHLKKEHSEELLQLAVEDRSRFLGILSAACAENPVGETCEFVAPYSNNFLCTKDFFEIAGGYDTGFRGHGSEDFEMIIRFGLYRDAVDLPRNLSKDIYSPARKGFFGPRSYIGFRRLAEVDSFRAESNGFKSFHLWHPTIKDCDWRQNNDWSRSQLRKALGQLRGDPRGILGIDYLERSKTALCVCKNPQHIGYFLPLRAIGYGIEVLQGESDAEIERCKRKLQNGDYHAFFIFNPYMSSHREFFELFEMAGSCCEDRVVIERGALPSSVYYAKDVSYADPEFRDFVSSGYCPSREEISVAEKVIERITKGDWVLEASDRYDVTEEKLKRSRSDPGKPRILVPLQLADDMAVTRFVEGGQSYVEFEGLIGEVARDYPDFEVLLKPHPLSINKLENLPENITVCAREDNIHALIDVSDFVLTYNSGVGLLALIHGKPVFSIGNAFYNLEGLGNRIENVREAFERVSAGKFTDPDNALMKRFVAWLCHRKYSFFDAADHIRHMRHRKSHEYERKMITVFNWKNTHLVLGRCRALSRVSPHSYIDGRLGMNIGKFLMKGILDGFSAEMRRLTRRIRQALR